MRNPNDDDVPELQALALVAVIEALPAGPTRSWFSAGVAAWLAGSPLEIALGLAGGQGKRSARFLYLQYLRDDALRHAHALMAGSSPWAKTLELAHEVEQFRGRIWPRWRNLAAPPEGASELRAALWRAFRAGPTPSSASRLHEICSCESPLFIG